MFLVLPIYLDVSHLKDEGFLVDELLDLEVVLPIGLTAHDASVQRKGILESGGRTVIEIDSGFVVQNL